jgi:hypothetical protein
MACCCLIAAGIKVDGILALQDPDSLIWIVHSHAPAKEVVCRRSLLTVVLNRRHVGLVIFMEFKSFTIAFLLSF